MYRLPLRKVEFGVEPDRPNAHTIRGELFAPLRPHRLVEPLVDRRRQVVPLPALEQRQA